MIFRRVTSHPVVKAFLKEKGISSRFIGWGFKGSGLLAKKRAHRAGQEPYLFEDAPIRSLRPGYSGGVYGITIDRKGAMFNASGESTLIENLNKGAEVSERVSPLIEKIREYGISKYNWSAPLSQDELAEYQSGVLLVDQTRGDASLKYSGAREDTFLRMFQDALKETPESEVIYLKTHPDRTFKSKKTCFPEEVFSHPRVKILPPGIRLADCFQFCTKVYVASSLAGMEALIHQCEVATYAWNFYAGWGLTDDRGCEPFPPRERECSLEEVFQAAYLDYSYYVDPHTLISCQLEDLIEHIAFQQKQWARLEGQYCFTLHLSTWHKHILERVLQAPSIYLDESGEEGRQLVWGMRSPEQEEVTRVEDGFIRSRGLGANFEYPLSMVLDTKGMYFDASTPSSLETIISEADYTREELDEGKELHEFMVENHISKYVLSEPISPDALLPEEAKQAQLDGRTLILVPGQVDSDASIKYGSPNFSSNQEFLAYVRKKFLDAYLVYKPHPDLLSHARRDLPIWENLTTQCDYVATEGEVISWIKVVDEVHTLTSTVGFEALLHEKPVFTYGLPFYAGWGLTNDELEFPRRNRKATLNELVTAVLIKYPIYFDPKIGEFIKPLKAAQLLKDHQYEQLSPPFSLRVIAKLKQGLNKCFQK